MNLNLIFENSVDKDLQRDAQPNYQSNKSLKGESVHFKNNHGNHPTLFKPYNRRFTAQESLEQAEKIYNDKEWLSKLSSLMGEEWAKKYRDRVIANHIHNRV